jgi:hypothetical protein
MGRPAAAAAVALTPRTDLLLHTGESQRTKVKVCLSPLNMAKGCCSTYYVGTTTPRQPLDLVR